MRLLIVLFCRSISVILISSMIFFAGSMMQRDISQCLLLRNTPPVNNDQFFENHATYLPQNNSACAGRSVMIDVVVDVYHNNQRLHNTFKLDTLHIQNAELFFGEYTGNNNNFNDRGIRFIRAREIYK